MLYLISDLALGSRSLLKDHLLYLLRQGANCYHRALQLWQTETLIFIMFCVVFFSQVHC